MRILLCLDYSPFSHSILPVVKRFADAAHADVELVQVIRSEVRGGEPWSGQQPDVPNPRTIALTREVLAAAAATFAPSARITVLEGESASEAIVKYARETEPDLIALATHSRGALGDVALGSTARDVTRAGVAPVLLLHPLAEAGMAVTAIPRGVYAFTTDGDQLGQVSEVLAERFCVRRPDGSDVWLPGTAAWSVTAGSLVLKIASSDVARIAIPPVV